MALGPIGTKPFASLRVAQTVAAALQIGGPDTQRRSGRAHPKHRTGKIEVWRIARRPVGPAGGTGGRAGGRDGRGVYAVQSSSHT